MTPRISDAAVHEATGRGWREWFAVLDERGGRESTHKQLVALLHDIGLDSGWWRQGVANEYEKHIGRRITGSTVDADFQIGVQKAMPVDADELWRFVTSAAGAELWLGRRKAVPQEPGATIDGGDGHRYELRTIKRGQRLRFRRVDEEHDRATTLQLTIATTKTGSSLHFHHEQLSGPVEREAMRKHWRAVTDGVRAAF